MTLNPTSSKGSGGGGSGTVTSVASANTAISVASPTTAVVLTLATLDVIAADGPPAADWSNNSHKITNVANGSGAQDAAAFGQIPTALPPNGSAGGDLGSTYPNPTVTAIHETGGPTKLTFGAIADTQKLKRSGTTIIGVADTSGTVTSVASGDTSIVVTNPATTPSLQIATLDVIATNRPPAADWSNNSHKITNVANGSGAQDAAAFGQLAAAGTGIGIFGDGSDGSVTFDGSTTILGMAPSSNVYTLTRDFFFSAVTLNNNVQIKTNGFRIFCSGTFTGGGAGSIIQWNGAAGVVTANGASVQNTSSTINISTGSNAPGTAGGAGGTAAGTAGTNSGTANLGGVGGVGGTGNGGANAGGAGGTLTTLALPNSPPRWAPAAILFAAIKGTAGPNTMSILSGGTGGGGGGGDGTAGGGGGSGGGLVGVYARTFAGTGAIQANGGAGGTPAGGNRGGGGGGGGGLVIVVSQSVVSGAISGWTVTAAAGAAGTSTGNGGTPGAAGAGTTILLPA